MRARAPTRARGMAEGEKSGGARGEKSCGVFSESGHICRESAPFFSLVERLWVGVRVGWRGAAGKCPTPKWKSGGAAIAPSEGRALCRKL